MAVDPKGAEAMAGMPVGRSHLTLGGSPFPPIADYGFLSDCEVTALVAPSGSVEWMCLPRMDGPSVFAAMLDRDAGFFRLGPADVTVPSGRRYLPGTMVLETTWNVPTGWAVVRDVLLVGPWRYTSNRSGTHRRVPVDHSAERVLLRTVRCLNGAVDFVMECEPAFDYGRGRGEWRHLGGGYGQAEVLVEGEPRFRLTTDLNVGFEGPRAMARRRLHAGEQAFCALSWSDGDPPASFSEAHRRLTRTADFWHEWISRGTFPDHPWRKYLQRSALTLKGLIYAPTGALLAAATSSLPETPGGERNYDYRFTWLRDATFMLWGLYTLGLDREADDFFCFIADLAEQEADLQIMYGIGGERDLTEHVLDHLSGYEGARPVRIGNGAWDQRQHDVWGVLLDSVYLHTCCRDELDERRWPMLRRQVGAAIEHWRQPDQGLWEVRGPARHFTASKVLCWVALDRGAKLALLRGDTEQAAEWRRIADEIHADVCAHGTDDRGVFCQHYDTSALDAAALLIPLVGFLPPTDPRVRATVLAIADELTEDELVLRYRVEETDDGFSGEEGTFTICSFWLVSALIGIGEVRRARALCEKVLAAASPLLLYAEEIDSHTGRHLGNFPQAFSHLALINAVTDLIREDARIDADAHVHSLADLGSASPRQ
ncbi:glycoside hydrolase family 15 protein [Nonomuraea sp. K274]|uniref:Trehalase n=1 Tax=Nonomuraea cypriaca TaxID=1187855 RepID=A0A931F0S3_9ACTN|nr:glycoside hydrolase family 15 protein [Nonomuraea cypriaca]MBF8191179.1 glycoside hydrolase family 15 protein [Nonomuraea cypriaca]